MEFNSASHMAVWSNQSSFSEDAYLATPSVFIQQIYIQNQPANLEKSLLIETGKDNEISVIKSVESRIIKA
jgi:hypothetical protein